MQWFGDPWPGELMPPGDPRERVATPVGQRCPLCDETVRWSDRGWISEMIGGPPQPRHLECVFAFLVVGVDAVIGTCLQCGVPSLSRDVPSRHFRARQIWDHYSDFHRPASDRGGRHRAAVT